MHFLGISGSLRKQSYNTAALRACAQLLPEGVTMELADISGIPLYNEEIREQGLPAAVQQLREKIAAADALVIATPEYNHGIPGVLKNAIDWLSRGKDSPLKGKPLAIMGASSGKVGTARAQMQMREMGHYLSMPVLPAEEDPGLVREPNAATRDPIEQAWAMWSRSSSRCRERSMRLRRSASPNALDGTKRSREQKAGHKIKLSTQ